MRSNSNPTTLLARKLRQTPNAAEQKLWASLKNRQLGDYKFTRQYPIGPYFADFACRSHFLAVELYGSQHVDNAYDLARDDYILAEGYSVLRLPSALVLSHSAAACDTILAALEKRLDECREGFDLKFIRTRVTARHVTRRSLWVQHTGKERGGQSCNMK